LDQYIYAILLLFDFLFLNKGIYFIIFISYFFISFFKRIMKCQKV